MTHMINTRAIAVLMAAYNADKFIKEQIESILKQTNQNWTLYIRNDGSMDRTSNVISEYVDKYPGRIVEIDEGGPNLGCRNNFFRLLEAVDSEYYMFSDADDVWLPEKIEISYREIRKEEHKYPDTPIMAYSDNAICDSGLNVLATSYWEAMNINPERFLSYNYMAVCCTAGGASSIFNKKVKELVFPLADNDLIYDYWIALAVAKYGKFRIIHRPLSLYRQHENQVCGTSAGDKNKLMYKFRHLKDVFCLYHKEALKLKAAGYGSCFKYYLYKFLAVTKIRCSAKRYNGSQHLL